MVARAAGCGSPGNASRRRGVLEEGGRLAEDLRAARMNRGQRRAVGGERSPAVADVVIVPHHVGGHVGEHLAHHVARPVGAVLLGHRLAARRGVGVEVLFEDVGRVLVHVDLVAHHQDERRLRSSTKVGECSQAPSFSAPLHEIAQNSRLVIDAGGGIVRNEPLRAGNEAARRAGRGSGSASRAAARHAVRCAVPNSTAPNSVLSNGNRPTPSTRSA